jgi:succinate-semialdehyde dehydrogenase/glutarate-semialdehyde dehydrogenase
MLRAQSFIDGHWYTSTSTTAIPVLNPANDKVMGEVELIDESGLKLALVAAQKGFTKWRATSAYERAAILQRGVQLLRDRQEAIAKIMTQEQGKPIAESLGEIATSADNIEWMAQESTRAYGRVLMPRQSGILQQVRREPVGPVAAFCPWNFPALTPARKIAGALAAGCSLILKPSEETPFTAIEIVKSFVEAGVPPGVLNLVFGQPQMVSHLLIGSPIVRKISFTGSTAIGKQLMALAAQNVQRATMELGGHAPVIVFDDFDPIQAAKQIVASKFRNAGQVCTSPTRMLVQGKIYKQFVDAFGKMASALRVGDGLDSHTQMGPLVHHRRVSAMQALVDNAVSCGSRLICGGGPTQGPGSFYLPTVLADVPQTARIMFEEPFGPVVPITVFESDEDAYNIANALPYGLAAYAMTKSLQRAATASERLEAGMVCINHFTVSTPASPFGGVKESGYGSEGGTEGLDAYLVTKSLTQRTTGDDLLP